MKCVSRAPLRATFASLSCPVPWAMFDQAAEAWVWRARDAADVWIGLGEAERCANLEQCQARLSALDLPSGAPEPCMFAAIAFDPGSPAAAPWSGFPPQWFVLPRVLLHWRAERLAVLTLNRGEAGDAETVAARICTLPAATSGAEFDMPAESTATPSGWRQAVEMIKDGIAGGTVDKVVLARTAVLPRARGRGDLRISAALRQLNARHDNFLFACKRGGIVFISASPERLLRVSGRRLETESLAGTRPRGATPDADDRCAAELLQSEKDLLEQRIVTEHLETRLQDVGCSGIELSPPLVRKHAAAQHLCTEIRAQLPPKLSADLLLSALHPTPAVCGQPADAARELIRTLEDVPRGYYGGAAGCVTAHEAELAVGIRSALLDHNRALLFAGAGIVAGSDADAEWQETEIKLQPMRNALSGVRD